MVVPDQMGLEVVQQPLERFVCGCGVCVFFLMILCAIPNTNVLRSLRYHFVLFCFVPIGFSFYLSIWTFFKYGDQNSSLLSNIYVVLGVCVCVFFFKYFFETTQPRFSFSLVASPLVFLSTHCFGSRKKVRGFVTFLLLFLL